MKYKENQLDEIRKKRDELIEPLRSEVAAIYDKMVVIRNSCKKSIAEIKAQALSYYMEKYEPDWDSLPIEYVLVRVDKHGNREKVTFEHQTNAHGWRDAEKSHRGYAYDKINAPSWVLEMMSKTNWWRP